MADLRRENGWLKEIVMLKGARGVANLAQQSLGAEGSRSQGGSASGSGSGGARQVTSHAPKSDEEDDEEEEDGGGSGNSKDTNNSHNTEKR